MSLGKALRVCHFCLALFHAGPSRCEPSAFCCGRHARLPLVAIMGSQIPWNYKSKANPSFYKSTGSWCFISNRKKMKTHPKGSLQPPPSLRTWVPGHECAEVTGKACPADTRSDTCDSGKFLHRCRESCPGRHELYERPDQQPGLSH